MNSAAPFDMLKYFGITASDEDELKVTQVAGEDGMWVTAPKPFFPDATLLVVLYKRGVRKIAVRHQERVTKFDLYDIIARDGELTGEDRADDLKREHPGNEAFCMHCKVTREACKPGGQFFHVCPFNPTEGGHRWVVDA